MARGRSTRSLFGALPRSVGAWLHPVSNFRPHSEPELELQSRVGLVSIFCIVTGVVAVASAAIAIIPDPVRYSEGAPFSVTALEAAIFLVLVSVFAPQAIFRTRISSFTRMILSNPSVPIRPWRSTTVTFNAVLVGAMLAGLYVDAKVSLLFFGLALAARVIFTSRRNLESDPNARFHNIFVAWTTAATGGVAFIIVRPLSGLVSIQGSIAPLVLAALVAMYVGLLFNAVERWVSADRTRWAFARDAVDIRRIVVALVSAVIAWVVAIVGDWVGFSFSNSNSVTGPLAGLGIFLASWLLLWFVSIQMWSRDATRTLRLWGAHQAQVTAGMVDGSLSPVLAARAALPATARIAASIFASTKTMVIVDDGRDHVTTHLLAVDLFENSPRPEPRDLLIEPSMRMELYRAADHPNMSSITVAGWLWTGWFMTRSRRIVNAFTELATAALLSPIIAESDDRVEQAFATMFDPISRWPSITAFERAVDAMQRRADENPHSHSLIIGVYAIDEFGALEGGRFEQSAVAQVMRLAAGHQEFAGHDLFVAYEKPGRVWIALSGGPIIRNGITTLRSLQQYINEHGSVPSARLDVDVHVNVSFGYAAHQVDEFTCAGLVSAALNRLTIDQGARDPFTVENLMTYDITPEDITGAGGSPVTAVNVLSLLEVDHASTTETRFATSFVPVRHVVLGTTEAIVAETGWLRSFGTLDLTDPNAFLTLVNRQRRLAAEAARVIVDRLSGVLAEAERLGLADVPIIVRMPASLLHPDAQELALPNLLSPALDPDACGRTVVLLNTVPTGAIQSLRKMSEQGVHIAVTAAAAAAADPTDLFGWQRWGIVFPQHVVQSPSGIDALTIQQTASAIATHDTRLIGIADEFADPRELVERSILWAIHPVQGFTSISEAVSADLRPST